MIERINMKRLEAIIKFINQDDIVADIGCDHGYLGIYLLKNAKASFVYAGDINQGPLQSAVSNAEKYGVEDKISFFLSDGLKSFPRDFDTAVCAGMGADTIVSILENVHGVDAALQNNSKRRKAFLGGDQITSFLKLTELTMGE